MSYNRDSLHGGRREEIHRGQRLYSKNRNLELVMQDDGNLVLYRRKDLHPLWASNTSGTGGECAIMQEDGNFVIYAPGQRAVWASNTHGRHGANVILQDDANLVIYQHGQPIWSTNTHGQCPGNCQDALEPGERLLPGRSVHSKNGKVDLVMQTDGNLVLYRCSDGSPLWASNTNGRSIRECVMQQDGNLVLYDTHGHAAWASNTHGNNGASLLVQDDGNVCLYRHGHCHWASGTHGKC